MIRLERKWWFLAPVCAAAALLTAYVMDSAGMSRPYRFPQWVLYLLCFTGFQRGLSFAAWLFVLFLPPSGAEPRSTK